MVKYPVIAEYRPPPSYVRWYLKTSSIGTDWAMAVFPTMIEPRSAE
jgi:hypothetical protein